MSAESDRAARTALRLEPNEGFALGALYFNALSQRQWDRADKLIRQALASDPSDCGCQHLHSAFLLFSTGRPRAALPALDRALALEPLSLGVATGRGWVLAMSGDFERAEAALAQLAPRDRDGFNNEVRYSLAMWSGRYTDARARAESMAASPVRAARIALATALAGGDRDATDRVVDDLKNLSRAALQPEDRWIVARLLAMAGRDADAIGALEAALEASGHNGYHFFFLYEPSLARARHLPAFERIFARYGLLDYWRRTGKPPEFCAVANSPALCASLAVRKNVGVE